MKSLIKSTLVIAFVSVAIIACKDDDDDSVKNGKTTVNPNEEELITTVEAIFSDTNGVALDTFKFEDPDGLGGDAPTIDTIRLNSNSKYDLSIRFLDESDSTDVENITAEIQAEDDEHLICFEEKTSNALNISKTDSDGTYPIGLSSRWEVGAAANGSIVISLKHQPGVKDGSCSPGETDIEVEFPLVLK
jgi:hypothetical protein